MAADAADWLERHQRYARTVTIKVRYADFTTITRSHSRAPATAIETTSSAARWRCGADRGGPPAGAPARRLGPQPLRRRPASAGAAAARHRCPCSTTMNRRDLIQGHHRVVTRAREVFNERDRSRARG